MKRNTLLILACTPALAIFLYLGEVKRGLSRPPESHPVQTFAGLTPDDITGITLQQQGATIRCELHDGWQMVQPWTVRADQQRLLHIAYELVSLQTQRVIQSGADRKKEFGLEHPTAELAFTTRNGTKHAISFGSEDFSQANVYAQIDEADSFVLLPDDHLDFISWAPSEFRDHSVLDIPYSEVVAIQLINRSDKMTLTKRGSGWAIEKPRDCNADPISVHVLLENVRLARVGKFMSDAGNAANYGFDHPVIELHLTLQDGSHRPSSAGLQVGRAIGPEYYARDSSRPLVFSIDQTLYQALSVGFSDLCGND